MRMNFMTVRIILEKKGSTIPPMQHKTCVLVIGRFQPPHLGHKVIINAAKKAWRKYKYDAIVVCVVEGKQSSKNKKQNPLSGTSRVMYLENSKFGKGIHFEIVSNAFDAFVKCRELGYEPMCVVGGKFTDGEKVEDRAQGYKELLDKYFKDGESDISHRAISITRNSMSDRVDGISGSIIRAAVISDRFEDFTEMISLDNTELISQMWNELRKNLV
jgi:cytidyltransferase-like protein